MWNLQIQRADSALPWGTHVAVILHHLSVFIHLSPGLFQLPLYNHVPVNCHLISFHSCLPSTHHWLHFVSCLLAYWSYIFLSATKILQVGGSALLLAPQAGLNSGCFHQMSDRCLLNELPIKECITELATLSYEYIKSGRLPPQHKKIRDKSG